MESFTRDLNFALKIRLTCLSLLLCLTPGCEQPPPTNEQIFVNPPASTFFASNNGKVILSALESQAVCYTINSDTPIYDNGDCKHGNSQVYDTKILLSCETGDTGESVTKKIQLTFEWPAGNELTIIKRTALFFLKCQKPSLD